MDRGRKYRNVYAAFLCGAYFQIYSRLSIDALSQNDTYYISMADILTCFILSFQQFRHMHMRRNMLHPKGRKTIIVLVFQFLCWTFHSGILFNNCYFLEEIPVWMLPASLFSIHNIFRSYILHLRFNHSTSSIIHYLGALENVGEN